MLDYCNHKIVDYWRLVGSDILYVSSISTTLQPHARLLLRRPAPLKSLGDLRHLPWVLFGHTTKLRNGSLMRYPIHLAAQNNPLSTTLSRVGCARPLDLPILPILQSILPVLHSTTPRTHHFTISNVKTNHQPHGIAQIVIHGDSLFF